MARELRILSEFSQLLSIPNIASLWNEIDLTALITA
jgi:hypothetical protein